MSTMYVVQSYTSGRKGSVQPDSPFLAQSIDHARRVAARLAPRKPLVVAFVREGNSKTGDFEEPKLIAAFGDVPEEINDMERV